MIDKALFHIGFTKYKNKEYKGRELSRFLSNNSKNEKLRLFLQDNIHKEGNNKKYIVFKESFYNDFIQDGNEKIICNMFESDNLAILINGNLKFIHNTFKSLKSLIELEGLKPRSQIKNTYKESDLEDTLGDGIYCYDYENYIVNNRVNGERVTKCSFVGNYNGYYIKCISGTASGSGRESNREYVILDNTKIYGLELIK